MAADATEEGQNDGQAHTGNQCTNLEACSQDGRNDRTGEGCMRQRLSEQDPLAQDHQHTGKTCQCANQHNDNQGTFEVAHALTPFRSTRTINAMA